MWDMDKQSLVQVEPPWETAVFVDIPEDQAQTRLWVRRDPGQRNDEIWVNMGAGGLGDSLLALCAIRGLRKLHPNQRIVFRINRLWHDFLKLFDGGYDGLAANVWDETKHDIPPDADPRDWQINAGYRQELTTGALITRLERYCRNVGVTQPELPALREPERLRSLGAAYANAVVLCPYAAWSDREWPLHAWQSVAELLRMGGFRVLILGRSRTDRPLFPFTGEVLMDAKADIVTAILLNARLVIANDSGLAHLSAIFGTDTVILCGWSVGSRIYSFYPRATCLQGMLHCNGCWSMPPHYDEKLCAVCANLATITPATLLQVVVPKLRGTPDNSPSQSERTVHTDRSESQPLPPQPQ